MLILVHKNIYFSICYQQEPKDKQAAYQCAKVTFHVSVFLVLSQPCLVSSGLLKELLAKQEMILDQQNRILGILQTFHHPNNEINESTIPKGKVPVETIEALKCLEAELHTDPGLKSNLISYLGLIGGLNLKDIVWRVMKSTISTQVARQMNWRGVNDKISLQRLALKTIIIDAVRRNPVTALVSDKDVEVMMVKWLHLAGDRDGGRKQRQKNADEKKRAEADS
ncbi:uncharacterized protein LOC121604163 [Chelmon rostratus]|uniref:uncharacterized protein LOC121604163 n=1 Tax=Chelmon rostratus TaxID=109905 RepID=UPI001BE574ED|nr:uncharacterized protein LOC121604163 [Chelmon rostratus]